MVSFTFAMVVTVVSDGDGNVVDGPVPNGILPAYFPALKARLSEYRDDVSGGRVQVNWASDVFLKVTQTMKQWAALEKEGQSRSGALTGTSPEFHC